MSAESPEDRATKRRVTSLEKELAAAQKARTNADAQAAELSKLVKTMREDIRDIESLRKKLADTEQQRDAHLEQVNTSNAALTLLRESQEKERAAARATLADAQKQIAHLTAQRQAVAQRLRNLLSAPTAQP